VFEGEEQAHEAAKAVEKVVAVHREDSITVGEKGERV
jgi:hypothetical protein